jgi:putative hydrolase of the HAD superfamily
VNSWPFKGLYVNRIPHWTSIEHWMSHFGLPSTDDLLYALQATITLHDDTIPALQNAAQRHALILLTSNDPILLNAKLDTLAIKRYFTHVISIPEQYGRWKKDSTVFARLLTELRLRPEELLHVGNDQTEDYDAPRSVGIDAVLIDRNGKHADHVITSLHELTSII